MKVEQVFNHSDRTILVKNVTKSYDGETILQNLNLEIPSGSFFALLGPSGSGKTTLLRLIGGFEQCESGSLHIGNTDITHMPIHKRRVNTVFQNYALFPHMNVFDNVAYPLKIAGKSKDFVQQKVISMLTRVHLEKHVNKKIQQLSGGQKQRVALARAIVNEPYVFLLDEPLAALDLKLREAMLLELIELQDALKTTFVYVTHDQFEALTVADYMAIMNSDGEIEQVGTPKQVYEFPKSKFVANFVGKTNIFNAVITDINDDMQISVENLGQFTALKSKHVDFAVGVPIYMSLRPEKIWISKSRHPQFANELVGTVQSIVYHGRSTQYNVSIKNNMLVQVFEQNEEHFPKEVIDYDDQVYLQWQKESVVLLSR